MRRTWSAMFLAALLALSISACGGAANSIASTSEAPMDQEEGVYQEDFANGFSHGGIAMDDAETAPEPMPETPSAGPAEDGREEKVILTARLELETLEFDRAAPALEDLAEDLGGYVESGSVGDRGSGYRWADYTIRVPAEQYVAYLNHAGELCHETWRDTSRQSISEAYYDTAGRLRTQQIKLERLQALLEEAENMADIITIESAISETEWMIEDLSGTLRHYDAQVDYATIHISLQEVYRLSNVEEPAENFTGRLGEAFSGGLRAFGRTLENLAVALAYSWVWVLLAAALVLAAVRILRKRRRTSGARAEKTADDKSGEM